MLPKEKLHFYFISLCYRLGNYLLTGRFFRKVKPRRKVLGEIINVGIPFLFMVSHLRILSCLSAFSSLFLKLSTAVTLQNIVCPRVGGVPETRKLQGAHGTKRPESFQGLQQYH